MDTEQIFMTALLGGIFAGAGGGLGALIAGFLPESYRKVVIGGLAASGLALSQFAGNALKSHSLKNEIHTELQKSRMFVVIEEEFPEEYARLVRELANSKSDESAFELGNRFTTNLRKTHAEYLKSASSSKLLDFIEADRRLASAIRKRDGDELCSAFLLAGPSALPNGLIPYAAEAELSVESLFLAISDGRAKSNPRSSPTEADWVELLEHWQTEGATEDMVAALANPDTAGTNFCGTYLSFLTSLISYEAAEADAIRAEQMFQKAILD